MKRLDHISNLYKTQLYGQVLPFWLTHGLDTVHGGISTGLSRTGTLLETDKSVWFQGRSLWTFSEAYRLTGDTEYLYAADSILNFLDSHCFDNDGRMFFRVTAEGKPVIKRMRYFFSEAFACLGYASYARATGNVALSSKAWELYEKIEQLRASDVLLPKFNAEQRPMKSFSEPMILLNIVSELRLSCPEHSRELNRRADELIEEIRTNFVHADIKAVLETVALDGTVLGNHFEGRLLNPGHAIEGAWFILEEGRQREKSDYCELGIQMLDWMWRLGWDEEAGGGIIHYRDVYGKSLSEYWHDMKFWWQQCEAAIATLMAYVHTRNEAWLENFFLVHDYIQAHLVDKQYGEWFGYLHRDGSRSTDIKGNLYKGPYHIPRMYMKCISLIDTLISGV